MGDRVIFGRALLIAGIGAAMVLAHIVDLLLGGTLKSHGIQPRELGTVYTIFVGPWLHSDFAHLGNNLAAFVVLGSLCVLNGIRYFLHASLLIITISGALVWLFGRDATHIGASGWIFGLWSLVIALAWFDRSLRNIAISIAVVLFYGGMIFGILPAQGYISYESHLFGALAGVIAASLLSKQSRRLTAPLRPKPSIKFWP